MIKRTLLIFTTLLTLIGCSDYENLSQKEQKEALFVIKVLEENNKELLNKNTPVFTEKDYDYLQNKIIYTKQVIKENKIHKGIIYQDLDKIHKHTYKQFLKFYFIENYKKLKLEASKHSNKNEIINKILAKAKSLYLTKQYEESKNKLKEGFYILNINDKDIEKEIKNINKKIEKILIKTKETPLTEWLQKQKNAINTNIKYGNINENINILNTINILEPVLDKEYFLVIKNKQIVNGKKILSVVYKRNGIENLEQIRGSSEEDLKLSNGMILEVTSELYNSSEINNIIGVKEVGYTIPKFVFEGSKYIKDYQINYLY